MFLFISLYTPEQFTIAIKKFRQELRDSGRNPCSEHPTINRMSRFMVKMCNNSGITPGSIQMRVYKDYGNAHRIIGLRKVQVGDPIKNPSQAWFMMLDEEYLPTYDAEIVELTAEEHAYLAERGLDADLMDLVDLLEPPATDELVPMDEEIIPVAKEPANIILDIPRSKSKVNYNIQLISQNSSKSLATEKVKAVKSAPKAKKNIEASYKNDR